MSSTDYALAYPDIRSQDTITNSAMADNFIINEEIVSDLNFNEGGTVPSLNFNEGTVPTLSSESSFNYEYSMFPEIKPSYIIPESDETIYGSFSLTDTLSLTELTPVKCSYEMENLSSSGLENLTDQESDNGADSPGSLPHLNYLTKKFEEVGNPPWDFSSDNLYGARDLEYDLDFTSPPGDLAVEPFCYPPYNSPTYPNETETDELSMSEHDAEESLCNEYFPPVAADTQAFGADCSAAEVNDVNYDQRWLKEIRESTNSRPRGPKCWEYLLRLLNDRYSNPRLIKWEDKSQGIFRLVNKDAISAIWGKRPCKKKKEQGIKYDSFARNIRYHYKKGKVISVSEKHLVYKFSKEVMILFANHKIL